ncbi:hypothetical protein AMJ49_00350 [Parcubacteria bacterium DG_74_2]|nr:MAG: hypothetical protein AMJ49_00350 [Parcubacteria bacterium DG_74_2]
MNLFEVILYKPLFNVLILFYEFLPGRDLGFAIILLTVIIRLILYPLMSKSIKSQKKISRFQKEIEDIREKFKEDKETQAKALISFYRKEKFNPFGGFLFLLIQLPILIALYQVLSRGFQQTELSNLYSFIPNPGLVNPTFLGLINLSQPNLIFAILAGILQFLQSKVGFSEEKTEDSMANFSNLIQHQMVYFFSVITFLFLLRLPSALAIYWITNSVFSIFQQHLIFKKHD